MKVRPLIRKHQPGPTAAYTSPPAAGPMTVPRLNMEEFRAIPLGMSSRSTSSVRKDWRAGPSKAPVVPSKNASTTIIQGCTTWLKTRAARTIAKQHVDALGDDQ